MEKNDKQYEWFIQETSNYLGDLERVFFVKKGSYYCVNQIRPFIETLVDSLNEMVINDDKRFIDKLYSTFLERYQSKKLSSFNNSIFKNRGFYSFFLNLFLVIQAYGDGKASYDDFCCVVDDVLNCDFSYDSIDDFEENFIRVWDLARFFAHTEGYKNMPNLRALFKNLLDNYDNKSIVEEINNDFTRIYRLGVDLNEIRNLNRTYSNDYLTTSNILSIQEALLEDKTNLYSSILLYDNRFFFVNSKLKEIEDNVCIRKEIFSYISEIDNEIFLALDYGCERDSFTECMNIVFDSDSYREMINKLLLLQEASYLFRDKMQKSALETLKKFTSNVSKDIYNDKQVSYPMNTMNIVVKPNKIIDRMKYLYSRIDPSISYDFMSNVHSDCNSIDALYEKINCRIGDSNKNKGKVNVKGKGLQRIFRKMELSIKS